MAEHRALTVCQPYAELIAAGEKRVENRTWPTRYRGPLLIHAGKSLKWFNSESPDRYVFGAIVASANLVACIEWPTNRVERVVLAKLHDLMWLLTHEHANGPFLWVLEDVRRLAQPIPAKGAQGIWTWQGDLANG